MQLSYCINGETQTLDITGDDLPALLRSTERRLQERHPELVSDPRLPIRIADGLLNSLAGNAVVVQLGELATSGRPAEE